MESCCETLEDVIEFSSDVYLVHLVRLQQKADRIGQMLYGDDIEPGTGIAAPIAMAITSLEQEINEIGPSLPLDIPQACI